MRSALSIFVLCGFAFAQVPDADAEGCKDSKLVNRIKGCMITECRAAEHDQAEVPAASNGDEIATKTLEGAVEHIQYTCPANVGPVQILRNIQNAFKAAGYDPVFEGKHSGDRRLYTARKGAQWVSLETDLNGDPMYTLTTVRVKEVDQELKASAEAWTDAMEQEGRVRVYGIQFDTGKASIRGDSEPVLSELLKLLQVKAEWMVSVEGHTDNVGGRAANLALSRQRAEAVIAWLAAKGIDKGRLTAAGLGDSKPVADNTTEDGRSKNRRVEIVKL